jgi:hypothetical protein
MLCLGAGLYLSPCLRPGRQFGQPMRVRGNRLCEKLSRLAEVAAWTQGGPPF